MQGNPLLAAAALTAFIRGKDGEESEDGALLIADGLDCLRIVRSFLAPKKK